jgi:hypothetical protein
MRKFADEGATQATLARRERERISKNPDDGGVESAAVFRTEPHTTLLIPLESREHVTSGFVS